MNLQLILLLKRLPCGSLCGQATGSMGASKMSPGEGIIRTMCACWDGALW